MSFMRRFLLPLAVALASGMCPCPVQAQKNVFLLERASQRASASLFSARLLLQWLISERTHKVQSPKIYWILSIAGAWLLTLYGWFREDFCRGPGNCFFVHPDGMVAPCCGFSNRQPELLLGPAGAGYTELMRRAGCSPAVEACFVRGLASLRKELEAQGFSFPGKTEDPCAFCGYTAAGCNR